MQRRPTKYFFYIAVVTTIFSFLIVLLFNFIETIVTLSLVNKIILAFVEAAIIAFSITFGLSVLSPALSDAMSTLRRLLRYESLSNPLLSRLSTNAPGTYHHSLNVSILAQKAAKAIGADSLLVRIAAYYHDIGKLEAPFFFVENQAGMEIPTEEDAVSIRKNAGLIIDHVKRGVEIARENRLPQDIINLIEEHHGTTRALYFFTMAKERGLKIKKTDFRYHGPIPQSRESAILMIADCVEAIARSYSNLTDSKIAEIVNNTIKERTAEKQFKNAGLSDIDMVKIKDSLISTLISIYHQRMEYKR